MTLVIVMFVSSEVYEFAVMTGAVVDFADAGVAVACFEDAADAGAAAEAFFDADGDAVPLAGMELAVGALDTWVLDAAISDGDAVARLTSEGASADALADAEASYAFTSEICTWSMTNLLSAQLAIPTPPVASTSAETSTMVLVRGRLVFVMAATLRRKSERHSQFS